MGAELSVFARRVLQLVSRIPAGQVATYGDLARMAGRPRAARAVGTLMRIAPRRDLPYHRVVAADGRLGGFGGRPEFKRELLRAEGLVVAGGRIRQFYQHRWGGPHGGARKQRAAPKSRLSE
jgi:O-6-methylguanine DNA methyltransferase